jgi:translation initiation factor 4G
MLGANMGYEDAARILRHLEAMTNTQQIHGGHWAGFLVAEVDGVPAAALTGFLEDDFPIEVVLAAANEANKAMGRTPEEVYAGWERAKSIMNVQVAGTPGAWTIEHVATHPEYRRRGLVDLLIAEILARGRERGSTVANIGVFIGNEPAQRAYEKAGFKVVRERRDAEFERVYGCPGARMMELAIQ